MPQIIQYSEAGFSESQSEQSFAECWALVSDDTLNWINLEGTNDADFDALVATLELHPLMVEDMRSKSQLPKFEVFDDISFMSVQMLQWRPLRGEYFTEHVSIIIGKNFVITVQDDKEGDVFDPVRNKIHNNFKRIAKNGVDYLFLSFIDTIVDEYTSGISRIRQPLEDIEVTMIKRPKVNLMSRIMEYKTELNRIRKFTTPLKEEMQRIRTENPDLIKKQSQALFRDILDHLSSLITNFDSYREMLRDLTELHQSNQNLMLNNTMKTLTVISAIFIPLTFVVGVYGMNFKYMPELEWQNGYFIIWGVMLLITASLIVYMRKKKWF